MTDEDTNKKIAKVFDREMKTTNMRDVWNSGPEGQERVIDHMIERLAEIGIVIK